MKHKAKSFIAVLLALCLMMSLGVGALADNGNQGGGGDPGGVEGSNPPEPRDGYMIFFSARGDEGGTVTVKVNDEELSGSSGTAKSGDEVIVTVTPDADYVLTDLEVSKGIGSDLKDHPYETVNDTTYKFTMPDNHVMVVATFAEAYDVTVKVEPEGSGSVTPSATKATQNTKIELTVSAEDGFELDKVTVDRDDGKGNIVAPNNEYFYMPNADVTVTATFKEAETPEPTTYNIDLEQSTGGTLAVEGDKTEAAQGETVYIIVTPDKGYTLVGLKAMEGFDDARINKDASTGKYYFSMPANDVKIGAIWQVGGETTGEHSITANVTPSEGGTVELSQTTADEGTEVTFTVKPNPGYEMDGNPRMTGLSSTMTNHGDGSYTFTMEDEDVTISVAFKKVAYAINVTTPDHGKVSTEPEAMAAAGTPVTLTAVPDKGYELVGYTVTKDGGGAVTVTNGQFVMPASAVTVTATFKLKQDQPDWSHWHKIDTWSNSVDGGISVGNDADMAEAGSTVTFRVWHNYRYDYYDYDVYVLNDRTGNRVSLDYSAYYDEYSFTMPEDDVTIYVYFDYAGRYSITKDVEGDGSIYVRSSADHGDTVWIEAAPNAGQSLTSLRVFYGEPWAYGDKGYYGYWDEAEVKYSTYWDAYYFTMPADDVVVYARFTDGATVDVIKSEAKRS